MEVYQFIEDNISSFSNIPFIFNFRKYYPDLSEDELKQIQEFVYELCCGLMQYFYGHDWEKDIIDLDLENEED